MPDIEKFNLNLKIGCICWFINPKISSKEPHPHVCAGVKNDNCVFLFCGTSQFDKKRRYFELNNISHETLVRIQSNATNTITKDTYINCNEIQTHDINDLLFNDTLAFKGNISESELFQIRNGIEVSDLMEQDIKSELLKIIPEF